MLKVTWQRYGLTPQHSSVKVGEQSRLGHQGSHAL